jgi:hypothetical protein
VPTPCHLGVFALPLGPSTATRRSSGTLRNRTVRCGEWLEPKHWCIVLWSADGSRSPRCCFGAALVLPRHPHRHLCIDTAIPPPSTPPSTPPPPPTPTPTAITNNTHPHCDTLLLCTSSDVCCCHLLATLFGAARAALSSCAFWHLPSREVCVCVCVCVCVFPWLGGLSLVALFEMRAM